MRSAREMGVSQECGGGRERRIMSGFGHGWLAVDFPQSVYW
jgi:hypothetical protein